MSTGSPVVAAEYSRHKAREAKMLAERYSSEHGDQMLPHRPTRFRRIAHRLRRPFGSTSRR